MRERLVIVGIGGFGRETLDVVRAQNLGGAGPLYELEGFVDSFPSEVNLGRIRKLGVPYLGTESEWLSRRQPSWYLVGIGDPTTRRRISKVFDAEGHLAAKAIHPSAVIGSQCAIGPGAVVCGGVQISTNVILGRHNHVNPNVTIGHDAVLEDFVSLNPGSIISGSVHCESDVLIGANAVVLQGLRVGSATVVGASACVTRDVDTGRVVKGIPARS